MIPKIIHYCWLSDDLNSSTIQYPKSVQFCIDSWKKLLLDYEFILWNFDRFPKGKSKWVDEAFAARKYASAADYIRLYALYNYGGIYLDTDVEVVKPYDDLLELPYFLGKENTASGIESATLGFEKGNSLIGNLLKHYEGRSFYKENGEIDNEPIPYIIRREIDTNYVYNPINNISEFNYDPHVVNIFPVDWFSQKFWDTKELNFTKNTYSIHHFEGSWLDNDNSAFYSCDKNSDELISIIIPVYNTEKYLDCCVDSVIKQTYKNLDILLVDDGSTDRCPEMCDRWAKIDQRIKVIHQKNGGLSAARNAGIRESNGDYVYFLDSDDKITVDCIEKMVKCITEHPDAEMVCGGAHATNGGFKYMDYEERSSELPYYTNDKNWINWAFLKHEMLSMTAWNKLIKKSLLNQYRLFFIEGIVNEDEIFNFQIAQYLSSVCFLHSNTYIYVIRDNSITTAGKKIQADRNWLVLFDLMLEHFGDEKQERQVSFMFYHCKMRVTWTEDPVLLRGIKKVLLKLLTYASFRQKLGLIFSYIVPINKMKKYMHISEKMIGKVKL